MYFRIQQGEINGTSQQVSKSVKTSQALKEAFLQKARQNDVSDMDVGDISQVSENDIFSNPAPLIGVFTFKPGMEDKLD